MDDTATTGLPGPSGPLGMGAADGPDGWSWTGLTWPGGRGPRAGAKPLVALASFGLTVLPLSPPLLHAGLVAAALLLLTWMSLLPRRPEGGWRLGPDGVSDLVGGRRRVRLPAAELGGLELNLPAGAVIALDTDGVAVATAPRARLGSLLAVVLAARARDVRVTLTAVPERGYRPTLAPVDRVEAAVLEALAAPPPEPVADALPRLALPAEDEDQSRIRWLGALAGVLLGSAFVLSTLLVPATRDVWANRVAAGVAGWLVAWFVTRVRRRRALDHRVAWQVRDRTLVVEDTVLGAWTVPLHLVAAAVPQPGEAGVTPHGPARQDVVVLVDRRLRPLAEIPTGSADLDVAEVGRFLRRHGVPWVDPFAAPPGVDGRAPQPLAGHDAAPPAPPSAPPPERTARRAGGPDRPTVVRDDLRTRLGVGGLLAGIVLVITAVLYWRASVVVLPATDPALVLGVGLGCALLTVLVCLPGESLVVTREHATLLSGTRRTRWRVHRHEVSAVAWETDLDRHLTRLRFYDQDGRPATLAVVPGDDRDVDQAFAEQGWPVGGHRPGPPPPPPQR